jgi:SAM-dependent methyltransferase
MSHWVNTYDQFLQIILEVDANIYANDDLTQNELAVVEYFFRNRENIVPIFDLACGFGRHAIALARRGYSPIQAVDYTKRFIEMARVRSAAAGLGSDIDFEIGDGRNLTHFPANYYPTVTMLGNSFGYWSDAENERILRQVYARLRKGGVFIFDVSDKDYVVRTLKPYQEFIVETPSFGQVLDKRWRSWNAHTQRIECRKDHIRLGLQGEELELLLSTPYFIRLYDRTEISDILLRCGFERVCVQYEQQIFDTDSGRPGLMSKRVWIAAYK